MKMKMNRKEGSYGRAFRASKMREKFEDEERSEACVGVGESFGILINYYIGSNINRSNICF